jgi:hypothetical protein
MRIHVVSPKSDILSASTKIAAPQLFVLEQDNWDDFTFRTQYQLHYVEKDRVTYIGAVKILKKGQAAREDLRINEGPLQGLTKEFCSLGQSLDYYERIAALPKSQQTFILEALRDVTHDPSIKDLFKDEEGWRTSVLRDFKPDDAIFTLAPLILSRRFDLLPKEDLAFTFSVPGWNDAVRFNFKAPTNQRGFFERRNGLPERIAVLIGRNGSGKSTLLSRIARVAYAPRSEREQEPLKSFGVMEPAGLGFPRIVTISYSPFDSFRVPGIALRDREQIAKDLVEGKGRFVFCGLRDMVREVRNELKLVENSRNFLKDRSTRTLLKPIRRLADEYAGTVQRVIDRDRVGLAVEAFKLMYKEPSFQEVEPVLQLAFEGRDTKAEFIQWGTGLKIGVQVILNLAAYTEPRSLVLFDEPETHLHPPLLAALMHSVRHVLERTEAFGIVATHSPVVLQETMSRHVHIVRREGDVITVKSPGVEVFGENIGIVTSEVFGLTSEVTDFHHILRQLTELYQDIEGIEQLFDRGLSTQARAYLMTIFAKRNQ